MARTEIYEKLLDELEGGELTEIEQKVFEALKSSAAGLTRRELVNKVFGVYVWPQEDINGNTYDRKIRKAIESLRKRLVPIVSSSGEAGYRLDTSRETIQKMIAELNSRIAQLTERRNQVAKFYEIPDVYEPAARVEQPSLL